MKKLLLLFLNVSLGVVFFQSCDDDPSVVNEVIEPCGLLYDCVFELPSYVNDTNLVGYISAVNEKNMLIKTYELDYNTEYFTRAEFCRKDLSMVNSGKIFIDEDTMEYYCISADCEGCTASSCWFEFFNKSLAFNGQKFTWDFSGNKYVNPFKIEQEAPKSVYDIITPQSGAVISKSQPLVIEWNGVHQPGKNLVRIQLHNPTLGMKNDVNYYTDDTGSFTVPTEALAPFPMFIITLKVGRQTVFENSPGKYIVAETYSYYTASFKVKD